VVVPVSSVETASEQAANAVINAAKRINFFMLQFLGLINVYNIKYKILLNFKVFVITPDAIVERISNFFWIHATHV
jgi:hypothetical protein